MAGSLDKLMLTVGLLDKITGPMKGIQKTIQQVTSNSRKAFMNTAAGVGALVAASASFASTVNPANDMNMALGEVRSLEVADSTLAALNQAGLKYSIEFGDQASNYVRSAYDIQSAIDGLVDDDLPRFTTAAGTLAKATKANVTDITGYFGTMYGIFKNQANEMGKGTWVEMLAGQTATAVQMFKTTGPEMSAAFGSIGADAMSMGVKLSEQMAILGSLQSTMSGSEAGTKYGAFLEGLSGAQDKLGLDFTDDTGALLPVVEILDMIKGQTQGLNSLEVQDLLSGAFGSGEAVGFIQLMSSDVNKLAGDIDKLGRIDGMDKATWMAKQMQDNFARLSQAVTAVSIAIWQKALPVIEPYIEMMASAAAVIVEWTDKYPHLTKYVGLAVTAFIAFVAVAGVMNIAIGLTQFAMVGLSMRFVLLKPIVWAARLVMLAWTAALWLMRTAVLAFVLYGPAMSAFFVAMKTGILTSLPAIWAFTAALLANPITWIVLGIVALVAAIVGLIVYWDEITAAINSGWNSLKSMFENNAWMKIIFAPLYLAITAVDAVVEAFKKIPEWWEGFKSWIGGLSLAPVWNLGGDLVESLSAKWSAFAGWIAGLSLAPVWNLGGELVEGLQQKWGDFQVWLGSISLMPTWNLGGDLVESLSAKWSVFAGWIAGLSLAPVWKLGGDLVEGLQQKWGDFQVWLGSVSLIPNWDLSLDAFESIKQWWSGFKGWLSALDPFAFLGDKVDWLKSKLSWLPGIDIDTSSTTTNTASSTAEIIKRTENQSERINSMVALPGSESQQSGGESGGLFQTISNMFGGSKKSLHVEKMEVNNHGQGVRGDDLMYQLEMEAG